ncbi:hypothetical protein [Vulgatibacter sp.]|uniref:hypothetical protein n=1 Tax=Vulgatibacter sp. TaxID=1971226 RepID=UPI003564EF9C
MSIPKGALPALLFAAVACGEGAAEPPPQFAASCRILAASPIGPHEAPLGFSADDAARLAPVRAGYRLLYGYDPAVDPAVGLEVGIEAIDPDRVFFIERSVELVGDVEIPCPQALTFPAVVRFRSLDGAFDEALPVDLYATGPAAHEWLAFVPLGSLRGDFAPVEERGWVHRGVSFGARFENGAAVGGVSLTSENGGSTRVGTVGLWGENPPMR